MFPAHHKSKSMAKTTFKKFLVNTGLKDFSEVVFIITAFTYSNLHSVKNQDVVFAKNVQLTIKHNGGYYSGIVIYSF